ncbi:MAG: hypothetical protein ABI693_03265 [Bryobacteraceae bacterium]
MKLITLALLNVCATGFLCGQPAAELVDSKPLPVREALVQSLSGAHLAGGIELSHCGKSEALVQIEQGTTVRQAFDLIKAVRPDLWMDTSVTEAISVRSDPPLF